MIAYLGFALTQDIFVIDALLIFYGLYQGIFRAVGKAFAADFVPEHLRASGIGWYNTAIGVLQLGDRNWTPAAGPSLSKWARLCHTAHWIADARRLLPP